MGLLPKIFFTKCCFFYKSVKAVLRSGVYKALLKEATFQFSCFYYFFGCGIMVITNVSYQPNSGVACINKTKNEVALR